MAQGLQLSQRLTQSLVLAPQLQQSLALLQAPTLELKALVEQELQQNPVLEEAQIADTDLQERTRDGETIEMPADPTEPPADVNFDPATEKMELVPIPTRGSIVRNVTVDSARHRLWLAESGVNRLGLIDVK